MALQQLKNAVIWLFKPFNPQKKRYWRIVFLCFAAAATFWLLNALNKTYTARISFPIHFVYNQQKLIPLDPLPDKVLINATGKGWRMLHYTLGFDVKPAELMLRNLPYTKFLPGSALRPYISNSLEGLQLNFVITDTLFFEFDFLTSRTIAFAVDSASLKIPETLMLERPVKIQPDSLTFTGPASILDTLPAPYRISLPVKNLTGSFKDEVPVEVPFSGLVKANVASVNVTVDLAELETGTLQVPIEKVNFPNDSLILIQPNTGQVTVTYNKTKQAPSPGNFKIIADYKTLQPGDSVLKPELKLQQTGLQSATLETTAVKVIDQRPASPAGKK